MNVNYDKTSESHIVREKSPSGRIRIKLANTDHISTERQCCRGIYYTFRSFPPPSPPTAPHSFSPTRREFLTLKNAFLSSLSRFFPFHFPFFLLFHFFPHALSFHFFFPGSHSIMQNIYPCNVAELIALTCQSSQCDM